MNSCAKVFKHEGLTFKATLSQLRKEESPLWLFPGETGFFTDFLVEVINPKTKACDPKYYKVRNVVHLPFSEKTLESCIETFKSSYEYIGYKVLSSLEDELRWINDPTNEEV